MDTKNLLKKVKGGKRDSLTEVEARQVLEQYHIPLVRAVFSKTADEAVTAAKRMGFPVVLKVVSPEIVHKTEVGGVALNLNSEEELRKAFDGMLKNVKKRAPKAKIEGTLVEKMMMSGQEVIIGGKEDSTFGKVLMFGLGGIFTELLQDTSIRMIPVGRNECLDMIRETKGYEIFSGYRGKKYDLNSIVGVMLKVSKLLEENKDVRELDINPLVVSETGAVAVDARIIV